MKKSSLGLARPVSSGALILAVSIFVALFSNLPVYKGALAVWNSSVGSLLFVGSLLLYVISIFVLVLSAVCHRRTVKPMLILFLMLSSVIAYFTMKYRTIFDHHMIANIVQTDTAEARDLFNPQILLYVAVLGVLPSYAVWRANLVHPHWKAETIDRLKLAGSAGAMLAFVLFAFSAHFASLNREYREVVNKINPTYPIYSVAKYVSRALSSGPVAHTVIAADARVMEAGKHRELVIMVVGETVRADHWGLSGYARDTTPLLRSEGVINFPDFWSCDTSTAKSVPCMFSDLGRAKFDVDRDTARDNALDVLKRAGVSVLWRDNNSSSKGVADRVAFEDYKTPKTNTICDGDECRDVGMLVGLQEHIDAQKGDVLIVLHQMGNHGPAYYKRYPKDFEKFAPVCQTNDLGSCSSEEISNAYDNAILYTDYFLSKVIELLKRNDSRFETAMLYVSDHGESLGEYGMYLHGTPYMLAPDTQKHIPAVVWLGQSIRHDLKIDGIEERRKRQWSHDSIYSTLLGFFEVQSTTYDPKLDLFEREAEPAGVSINDVRSNDVRTE